MAIFLFVGSAYGVENIIVTATKTTKNRLNIPFSVGVVEKKDIQNKQLLGLDESMSRIPGLFFSNKYNYSRDLRLSIRGFGARSNFGIRGIKVFIDGMPSTAPDGQTALDDLDLSTVSRIEVLRGPSSSLYGASSGGVVNIFTEDGSGTPSVEFGTMAGEYSFFRNHFKAGGDFKNLKYFLSSSHLNYGGYRRHSDVKQTNFSSKASYKFHDGSIAKVSFRTVDSPYAEDSGGMNEVERSEGKRNARQRNIDLDAGEEVSDKKLSFSWEKETDGHKLLLKNYYNWRQFDAKLPLTPFIGAGIVKLDRFFVGGGAQYTNLRSFKGLNQSFIVGLDVESMSDDRRRFNNLAGAQGPLRFEQEENADTLGIFYQQEINVTDRLRASGGLRYDRVKFDIKDKFLDNGDQSDTLKFNEVTYSVGASFEISKLTSLYANYSTGFETPTFTEFANPSNNGSLGGFANVAAQRSNGFEIGIKGAFFEDSFFELVYYDIDVEDEVTTVSNIGGRAFFNNADTERKGVEISFDVNLPSYLTLYGVYSYSDFEFVKFNNSPQSIGSRLPGVPKHNGNLGLNFNHPGGFYLDVNWGHTGSIFTNNINTVRANQYDLTNVLFGFTFELEKLTLNSRVGINNLFKQDYNQEIRIQDATRRFFEPGPGRNFYGAINLIYEFSK